MGSVERKCHIILKVVIVLISFTNVAATPDFKVTITPPHVHIKDSAGKETITCNSTIPVKQCQIRVFDLSTSFPTVLNVKETNRNDLVNHSGDNNTESESRGCAITLSGSVLSYNHLYAVACRARTNVSAWSYDFMSVYMSYIGKIDFEIYERQAMANFSHPGRIYITSKDIDQSKACTMVTLFYNQNDRQKVPIYSKRVVNQYCLILFSHAAERENGIFVFELVIQKSKGDKTYVFITVTKPPNLLTMSHEVSVGANGSRILTVTCTVTGSRPAAYMIWYLGSELFPAEHVRSLVHDDWLWPFSEQTTSQELKLTLTPEHVGKQIHCVVTHVALQQPQQATLKIIEDFLSITDPPIERETPPRPTLPPPGPAPSSVPRTEEDKEHDLLQAIERKMDTWFVVLAVLLIILFILVIAGILRYYCSCSKLQTKGTVRYRRSLEVSPDRAVHIGPEQSPCPLQNSRTTASSLSQSSAVTGVEFAEIRTSMVQRCVDKINATDGRPSSETGEVVVDAMHCNSIYMSYSDQPM